MSIEKRGLERHLTASDRRRIVEQLGFKLNGQQSNGDGYITGVLGPAELGEGENGNFSVNVETGAIRDFGSSGWTGSLYDAVMEVKRLTFPEALRWIAKKVGYAPTGTPSVTKVSTSNSSALKRSTPKDKPSPVATFDEIQNWHERLMSRAPEAEAARAYLVDTRKIDPGLLGARRVGLARDRKKQSGVCCTWWIIFPARVDLERQVVTSLKAFAFDPETCDWKRNGDGKKICRNAGPTEMITLIRDNISNSPVLYVGGEVDAFSAHSVGYDVLTGTGGEMPPKDTWINQVVESDLADRVIVVCFDGDEAGRSAAPKAAQKWREAGFKVHIADLPDGNDVNDLVIEGGRKALDAVVGTAAPFEPRVHDSARDGSQRGRENSPQRSQRVIHDSRSYSDRETVNAPVAEPLFGFDEPEPLQWKVDGLVPEEHVTVLAADGGTGKSYLAVYLSLCVTLGRSFFSLKVRRGRVLYVDYELDLDEQRRRVTRVAGGLDVSVDDDKLDDRIYYYRPTNPLGSDEAHTSVLRLIEEHEIDLVILDSLTVGSAGADVTASEDVVPVMQRFRQWGTVLAIDHVSAATARGSASKARPFGSVFKRNIARSTLTLAQTDAGGFILQPDKNNFAAKQDLLTYEVTFEAEKVTFERVDVTDDSMAGALSDLSTHDVTLAAIKALHKETRAPVPIGAIVQWREDHELGIAPGTVRNHLTVLERKDKIERTEEGAAVPVEAAFTMHDDYGDRETVNGPEKTDENGSQRRAGPTHVVHDDDEDDTPTVNGRDGGGRALSDRSDSNNGSSTPARTFDYRAEDDPRTLTPPDAPDSPDVTAGDRVETPAFTGTVREVDYSEAHCEWRVYVRPGGGQPYETQPFFASDVTRVEPEAE